MAHFKQFGNGFLIEALLETLLIKALLYSDKWHDLETET